MQIDPFSKKIVQDLAIVTEEMIRANHALDKIVVKIKTNPEKANELVRELEAIAESGLRKPRCPTCFEIVSYRDVNEGTKEYIYYCSQCKIELGSDKLLRY